MRKYVIWNNCVFQQSEVETYLDRNVWSSLTGDYGGKDMLADARDFNFVDTSILIDTREGIHGELGVGGSLASLSGLHHVTSGSSGVKDEGMSVYHSHHHDPHHHDHHDHHPSSSPPLHMSKG